MAIPDFQSLMLPLLKFAADGKEHAAREATDSLSQLFQLSDEEKEQLLPSGQQTFIGNRVYWALTHLKHAGILESTRRGYFKISQRGLGVLQHNPSRIDLRFLSQFPEYLEFRRTTKKEKNGVVEVESELLNQRTPEELFEESYRSIRQELAQELLNQVKKASPGFFERLVVDLLVKMGYGGSTFKLRSGTVELVVQRFKNLSVLCMDNEPGKVFLLRLLTSQATLASMSQILIAK